MGKGRIITDHGEGLYTIELLEDRVRAETSRTLAAERVASLDDRISDLEVDLAAAQAEVDSAADAQDQAIATYQAEPTDESRAAMTAAGETVIQAAAKRDAIAGNIRVLKTERLALQRRIDRIDALPALRQQQAWCADLTESLAGEVGTAEVPGQAQQVLVHPGHEGAAAYDQARDGALQPALSGTPASVYYNLAMLPGWQKWRPTYRIATITSLSTGTDSCDIDIEPATSSEQGLNVNAQASYAGVPIQYMTCHASAFEVGDRVMVRFDRHDQSPTVIGFESNPRACQDFIVVKIPVEESYTFGPSRQGLSLASSCECTSLPAVSYQFVTGGVESIATRMYAPGFDERRSIVPYGIEALALAADGIMLGEIDGYKLPRDFLTFSAADFGALPAGAVAEGSFENSCDIEEPVIDSSLAPRTDASKGYFNFRLSANGVGAPNAELAELGVQAFDQVSVDYDYQITAQYEVTVVDSDQAGCAWAFTRSIESADLSSQVYSSAGSLAITDLPDITQGGKDYEPMGIVGFARGYEDEAVLNNEIHGWQSVLAVYKRKLVS